jgi:hypothetical protein
MPTKKQIYEIVALNLSGGVPQRASKFSDPRPIYAVMDTVRDDLVKKDIFPMLWENKFLSSSYVFTYEDVAVGYNSAQAQYFARFPVKLLSLPDNKQVQRVAPMQDLSSQFVYTTSNTSWLFKNNEAAGLQNNKSYYVERDMVVLPNINPNMTRILLELVPAGESITEGDFYISNELMQPLIAATMQLLSPMMKPEDKSNNDVSG